MIDMRWVKISDGKPELQYRAILPGSPKWTPWQDIPIVIYRNAKEYMEDSYDAS